MLSPCPWFPAQAFQPRRYRPGNIGNWSGHLPFAHDLVAALRPACLVELGTHLGESYFGFCQAIAETQAPCVAYAVDTWTGEEHSGFYDNSVYEEVLAYNKATYASFSYLLRSLFDDALQNFSEDSIDILHIDGLHTFEAVSRDFYSWLPKVRPGGIILLHDVCVRDRDFGVWKLWEKLKTLGDAFDFHHSWGLGVFRKPGGGALESELLKALFEGSIDLQEQVRRYYSLAANELESKHRDNLTEDHSRLQIYLPINGGYQEERSQKTTVKPDQWQCVTLDIPEGSPGGAIRLDPADHSTIVDVRSITLLSSVDQTTLWNSTGLELSQLRTGGTLMFICSSDENGACRFFSYGTDPQLYLPSLDTRQLDQPLTLRVWLRLHTDLNALRPLLDTSINLTPLAGDSELFQILQSRVRTLTEELQASQRDLATLTDDADKKQTRLYLLNDLRQELKKENEDLQDRFVTLERTYFDLRETFTLLETAHSELQSAHKELHLRHQAVELTLMNVLRSRSWRLTAPLRSITETLKDRSTAGSASY